MKKNVKEIPQELTKRRRAKASHRFVTALAIVSIAEFLRIITETIFNYDISFYNEAFFMFVIGVALVLESDYHVLKTLRHDVNPKNFNHLTTAIVGVIAIVAGIFSLPQIRLEHPMFLSVKGIISIIAIIVIIVQTWIAEH